MLTAKTEPKTVRPKASEDSGAFSLDLRDGDRIRFLDSGECEHCRGDQVLGRYGYRYDDDSKPLQKKAQVERTQMGLVPGTSTKVGGGNVTNYGKEQGAAKNENAAAPAPAKPKAPAKQEDPNERWITLHSNPNDPEAYTRVKIRVHPDGTGSVIAGAGGKLNQLRLTKLKSPEEWKQNAAERKAARDEKQRKRLEGKSEEEVREEEEAKKRARELHLGAKHQNALETLQTLDKLGISHGLSEEHLEALQAPPAPDSGPQEIAQWKATTKEAVETAQKIQRAYEHKLVTDHEARAAARLGDEALGDIGNSLIANREHTATAADGEAISSIIHLPDDRWLVRSTNPEEGDKVYEDWEKAAKAHAGNVALHDSTSEAPSQPEQFYNPKLWIKEHPEEELPEGFTFKAEAAGAIAALGQQRRDIDRKNKQALKQIQRGQPWDAGKGFDAGDGVAAAPAAALAAMEADAKTIEDSIVHGKLLDLVGMLDPKEMRKHLDVGGAAQLGEMMSDILKVNPLDPALVATLGYNEAAKLAAYQVSQNVSPREYEQIKMAVQTHHSQWSTDYAKEVTEEVEPQLQQLKTLHDRMLQLEGEKGEGDWSPDQQIELDNLSYQAKTLNSSIQKTLGTALGQLQASAAMSYAIESRPRSLRFAVDGESTNVNSVPGLWGGTTDSGDEKTSIWQDYGLTSDDFSLEDGPDGQLVTVKPSGLEKLTEGTYDPEDRAAYERAIAIKRGDFDEEGFVPAGFAYRPKHTFTDVRQEAEKFDTRLEVTPDMQPEQLKEALRTYLGARVANGDNPLAVRTDLFSPELYLNLGLSDELSERVRGAVDGLDRELFSGRRISDAEVRRAYQELGDAEAAKQRRSRATDDMEALHSQSLDQEAAVEAAHRTLAALPMARAAMKPLEQLTPRERKHLREYAITQIMGEELEQPQAKSTAVDSEPEEVMVDLFGNVTSAADIAAEQRGEEAQDTQWQRFSKLMGGDAKAYAAIRDKVKGQFLSRFASAYGAVGGKPVLTGQQTLQHIDRLLLTQMNESQRAEMLDFIRSRQQSDIAKVRSRAGGKFAAEVDDDWLARYEEIKGDNRQMSLLQADTGTSSTVDWQRVTLGEKAEQDLEAALSQVLPNFEQIDSAVNIIPEVKWDGGFVAHQRGLKFIEAQKKVGAHFSAGAGKSALVLGSFSHLHSKGLVKRSIVAVPSAILGQFVGEAATFLEPGKYNYNANIGWNREKRLAALRDGDLHCHVTTRESLSNDLLHLVEKHTGISPDDFQNVEARSEDDRRELMGRALRAENIDPSSLMFAVDEAHDISRRKGVKASKRSLALDALGHHSSYLVAATGTPLKNDVSEIADFLHKVGAPEIADEAKFFAKYGKNTEASQRALQRVMAKYAYSVAVKPQTSNGATLQMRHTKPKVELTQHQKEGRTQILKHYDTVQKWYTGEMKRVLAEKAERGDSSPLSGADFARAWDNEEVRAAVDALGSGDTWGSMSDEQKAQAIGGQVMAAAAIKSTALSRLYHRAPYEQNAKAQKFVEMAKDYVSQGKPVVGFSASSEAAAMLKEQLEAQGLRVGLIDGGLSAEQKTRERLRFSPGKGVEPETDVLICTDAAQTGLNLQRGKALIHFDVPMTAKAWDQRSARIYRRGQTDDVDVHTLMADAPEEEIALARMERKGREGKIFQGHDASRGPSELLDDTGLAAMIEQMRAAA